MANTKQIRNIRIITLLATLGVLFGAGLFMAFSGGDDDQIDEAADGVVCAQDVHECSDGSFVSRVAPTCEFAACPSVPDSIDGPSDELPTPGPVACTEEALICPDGSVVGRIGPNCEFEACPVIENAEIVYPCDQS